MKTLPRLFLIMSAVGMVSTTFGAWQRLPSEAKRPVEIAVSALQNTHLESSSRIERAQALLSDEVTPSASLPTGKSDAVISFGHQSIIERVAFHNLGGEGKFTFSASSDNENWTPLGQILFSPSDVHVVIPFADMQCKYVKAEFDLQRGLEMRHFEVFGRIPSGQDYEHGQITNMATSLAGSRIIYIHPTPKIGSDESVSYGNFDFPDSDDKYRTVVYDLGSVKTLSEFGSVHSTRPVRFEVFVFEELPEQEDWRGRRTFDPAVFEETKPVASYEDKTGKGFLRIKASQPVMARYVAMRWEPDFNPPAFSVPGAEIIGPPQQLPPSAGAGGSYSAATQPYGSFVGAFAPNSLMGAGSGGLPFIGGGVSTGGGPGPGGGGGGGGLPDIPGPSPNP